MLVYLTYEFIDGESWVLQAYSTLALAQDRLIEGYALKDETVLWEVELSAGETTWNHFTNVEKTAGIYIVEKQVIEK